jgi:mannose-6-phosphate isomerase
MWYIMEADKGAELISGFNQKLDKTTYLEHFKNKALKEILNSEKAEKGDVFFIPAGRVHAIGKGILLTEIQQTSNITYRIYDWDRVDALGKGRELHTELAVDAIDYNFYPDYKTVYQSKPNQPNTVVDCNYFTTNVLQLDKIIDRDYFKLDSFVVYICTEGEAEIEYSDTDSIKISQGDSILLPAVLKDVRLKPSKPTTLLEVYIK